MVYRVTENGGMIVCDVCSTDICSRCHVKFHNGISCDNFKFQTMNSEMLLEWMHQDPEKRKKCPECSTVIEKDGGCQRVCCRKCEKHICWRCMKYFNSARECYEHLRGKHGSVY